MKEEEEVMIVEIDSLDELLIKDEAVLAEVVKEYDEVEEGADEDAIQDYVTKWYIIKVGAGVTNYEEGDLIYAVSNNNSLGYFDALNKNYMLTDKYNIKLGVRKK